MNFLLILRPEIACLILLVFFFISSRRYKLGKDDTSFFWLSVYAICHVIFDMITVYTVNRMDIVPRPLNKFLHLIFYLSAMMFTREILLYTTRLLKQRELEQKVKWLSAGIMLIYLVAFPFLPMVFLEGDGTMYSYGMAAYVGYAIAYLFLFGAGIFLIGHYSEVPEHARKTMLPMLGVMVVVETVQIVVPEFLFTGAGVTIATVGIFFGMENPYAFFQRKAMLDTMTGVKSRNAYENDMAVMRKEHEEGKFDACPVGLVFCDLNGLKTVNNVYGHLCGDEYIGVVAQTMAEKMPSVKNIYRFGGDEFLAVYVGVSEDVIRHEIEQVHRSCKAQSKRYPFRIEPALGFAMLGEEFPSLRDVLNAADRSMYEKKREMKKKYDR